jgi:autotransporter-associated beta strand protein
MKKILVLVLGVSCAWGQTWTGATSTDWNVPGNWSPNTVPNNATAAVTFSGATLTNQPSVLGNSFTFGSITFTSTSTAVTISSTGGSLIPGSATAPATATITVNNPSDIINAPIQLTNPLTTAVLANSTLTFGGQFTGAGLLTLGGAGTAILTGTTNNFSGGITVNGGTLNALSTGTCLGAAGQIITLSQATLQAGGPGILTLTPSQTLVLKNTATLDTNTSGITVQGTALNTISGTGSLNVSGGGTLAVLGTQNSYTGSTTVLGTGTILNIYGDGSLGESTAALVLNAGTQLTMTGSVDLVSTRNITLVGAATISNASPCSIAGIIAGTTGALTVEGGSTLTLSGANTYLGPTNVNGGSTLIGTTTSLQGAMNMSAASTVEFNQATAGTYAGVISGAAVSSELKLLGGGPYTFTGSNTNTAVQTTTVTGSDLIVTGALYNGALTVDSASSITGTGTLGSTVSIANISGRVTPGQNFSGTLNIEGSMTLNPGGGPGTFVAALSPTTTGVLNVSGTATLTNSTLDVELDFTRFFGTEQNYLIMTAAPVVGVFSSVTVPNPNFSVTPDYSIATQVSLNLRVLRPFEQFSCGNFNECAVARNLDSLNAAESLTPGLSFVVNSLVGETEEEIQQALDQMHPAALSAFAETQTVLGAQVLSLSHRKPTVLCGCQNPARVWVEPFGNWLHEKQQGMEIGFRSHSKGVVVGCDYQFAPWWTLGVSGAYDATDLHWDLDRGYAYTNGAYGALYSDFLLDQLYMGVSGYVGRNWYQTQRKIQFATIDAQAVSSSDAMNAGLQWTAAYYFGRPLLLFYPYLTADYLYLQNSSFTEREAGALNLTVRGTTSHTLRTETGISWEFTDRNPKKTVCISPLFSIGYVLEWPMERSYYEATFQGETLPFFTRGWVQLWQLWSLRVGLGITYHCFVLNGEYSAEIAPQGGAPFVNQRANFRFSYNF